MFPEMLLSKTGYYGTEFKQSLIFVTEFFVDFVFY